MKKILSLLIVASLFLSLPLQVAADSISDKKSELNTIKDKIENANSKLNNVNRTQKTISEELVIVESNLEAKKKELHSIEQELTENQALLTKTKDELNVAEQELEQANDELDFTRRELEKAIQNAQEHEKLMADRLRTMYMNKNTSYLELLFESKSLNDFFTKVEMIKQMVFYDNQIFDELEACRDDIDQRKTECVEKTANIEGKRNEIRTKKLLLEEKTQDISSAKSRVISQRASIERTQNEKNRLLKQLDSEESLLKKELAKLDRETEELEKKIRELTAKSKGQYTGGIMAWPVPGYYRISSGYGMRLHPIYRVYRMHKGIDIASPGIGGKKAVAAADGIVILSEYNKSYGNYVIIDHGGGISTRYAHGKTLLVTVGQKVTRGTPVLLVGTTGSSTGNHLHFEVRKYNKYTNEDNHTDPLPYLRGK